MSWGSRLLCRLSGAWGSGFKIIACGASGGWTPSKGIGVAGSGSVLLLRGYAADAVTHGIRPEDGMASRV